MRRGHEQQQHQQDILGALSAAAPAAAAAAAAAARRSLLCCAASAAEQPGPRGPSGVHTPHCSSNSSSSSSKITRVQHTLPQAASAIGEGHAQQQQQQQQQQHLQQVPLRRLRNPGRGTRGDGGKPPAAGTTEAIARIPAAAAAATATEDYYRILGVSKDAGEADLKKAYRKLAMKWHPDKHADPEAKKKAEAQFKDIAEAYDVLSDKERRQVYDKFGEEGLKAGGPSSGGPGGSNVFYREVDPSEIFSRFFGTDRMGGDADDPFSHPIFGMAGAGGPFGMRFSASTGARRCGSMQGSMGASSKPRAYERDLVCSLEELYSGTTKKMKIGRTRFHNGQPVKEDSVVAVDVKAGWKEGTKVTFAGEGGQEAPNGPPGDLVFVVKCRPHARFVRDGSHLVYRVPLPLIKALTGFTVAVTTLDNRTLHVKVDEVVSPKFRKVVPGEGMPISKKPGEKGDLIIEFDILFPRSLTDDQKKKLKDILGNS
ncbi:hypothetical protein Efla_002999 [Eimeria flavescens]